MLIIDLKMLNKEGIRHIIKNDWQEILCKEFEKKYFEELIKKLNVDYSNQIVYPAINKIFKAFNNTSFSEVKVVILGQDPYHGANQANGLSFSVNADVPLPPSLKNIFQEINNDIGETNLKHGDLTSWTKQGVLLMNSSLTVIKGKAGSHSNIGWETFTNNIIKKLSSQKNGLVFILWGNFAKSKEALINKNGHLVLKSAHPSPLSAYRGFWGSKHFSKTNFFLKKKNKKPIDWQVS